MDYLGVHGPLIERSSFMPEGTEIPTSIEEVAEFLPGKTRFTDIDDLLINIGKKHDRAFLHMVVSKLFLVPQSVLVDAERDQKECTSVTTAVYESRKLAKDAARAVASSHEDYPKIPEFTRSDSSIVDEVMKKAFADEELEVEYEEYADPEHLCEECLPVVGDEIIGTKPADGDDAITTVHRVGCPRAQDAVNAASAARVNPSRPGTDAMNRVSSVSLRMLKTGKGQHHGASEVPVKLQWSDFNLIDDDPVQFLTEIVVVAEDRKLLLADCSEIVSELSTIVKTGSLTTREHATLEFLVQVESLETIQRLMDDLRQVRSVMSVERRVGDEIATKMCYCLLLLRACILTSCSAIPFDSLGAVYDSWCKVFLVSHYPEVRGRANWCMALFAVVDSPFSFTNVPSHFSGPLHVL